MWVRSQSLAISFRGAARSSRGLCKRRLFSSSHFLGKEVRPKPLTSPIIASSPSKLSVKTSPLPKKSRKGTIILSVSVLGTLGLLYATKPDNVSIVERIEQISVTVSRIGVVTVATVKCFALYKSVLGKSFATVEEWDQALSDTHKKAALITRKALETNAGIFIKLGQHISALTYLFPPEWTETMIPLQDCCPVSSLESIGEMVKNDIGKDLDDLFTEFDPIPLGTASLAQVHRARLKKNGAEVAVKFQHPSLKQFVPLDILMTRTVFNIIDYFFPEYPLLWLSDELQSSIYVELDFRNEAKNAKKTAKYFKDYYDITALRVPEVYWAEPRIMTMEYLSGARPDDLEFLDSHHISRGEISICFAHIFNSMVFTPNVGLHCDPHAGNIAIRPLSDGSKRNFEIILYDHGLYRDVPTDLRRSYAHFWLALLDKDEPMMRKYAAEFAGITDDQFPLFAAAITGRDFDHAINDVVSKRTPDEIERMAQSVAHDGLLSQIMVLLHSMPRIVLLILKTNDLTRYLDEKLDSPLGVERGFLVMAQYCARTVFEEGRERILSQYRGWSLTKYIVLIQNWWGYLWRMREIYLYESLAFMKSIV